MKLRQRPLSVFTSVLCLACLVCLLSLSGIGCGSGHGGGHTATIAMLRGDRSAMANPVGADGLTPVGSGFIATGVYFPENLTGKDTSQHVSTNSSGRVVVEVSGHPTYYYYAANQCSTVVAINYDSDIHAPNAGYDSNPDFNNLKASDAMKQKAILATKALGVDAVILVGTDIDVCTAE